MKIASLFLAAAATLALAHADDTPAAGTVTAADASSSPAPSDSASPAPSDGSSAPSPSKASKPAASGGKSTLDSLKATTYGSEFHMKPVRVVHARVQSDTPAIFDGVFASQYGKDLASGYLSAMDTVNTASVEGALMYVQAEGINQNSRSKEDRCVRKNKMNKVVFYEILIAQTNETIAQFQESWNQPEYGPMIPMDSGRCTPLSTTASGEETLPVECLQFNGDDGQPNIGPFIGAGIKDDDVRAPYPDNYWFSFPNSCPNQPWGAKKTDECRKSTRNGLCKVGQAPDGVSCTFAYDILGWVPLDDVVGISNFTNEATGKPYANFTEWCQASETNIEFAGDDKTGKMEKGIDFWKDPLDPKANAARANKVVELYDAILDGSYASTQITAAQLKLFKPLPTIEGLRAANPACYNSVSTCNSGNGCRREGFSQFCRPCSKKDDGCEVDSKFTFPKLAKASTTLSADKTKSGASATKKNGTTTPDASMATPNMHLAFGVLATTFMAVLAL